MPDCLPLEGGREREREREIVGYYSTVIGECPLALGRERERDCSYYFTAVGECPPSQHSKEMEPE